MKHNTTPNSELSDLRLLDSREAAELLGCCERTVWQLGVSRQIPRIRVGRLVRFRLSDLRQWLESQVQGGDE